MSYKVKHALLPHRNNSSMSLEVTLNTYMELYQGQAQKVSQVLSPKTSTQTANTE